MKLTQKLRKLVYGYSNIILVDFNSIEDVFKEIEIMRSLSTIEGWIFRPNFAKGTEFVEYSVADYQAIYAQWSMSFGWADKYELLTGKKSKDVLSEYKKDYDKDLTPLFTKSEKETTVESIDYIYTIANDIASSKTVLTENQKEILLAMPNKVKLFVFKNTRFFIRETKVLLVKAIMSKDSSFNPFDKVEDIVPLTVSLYNRNGSVEGRLTTNTLRDVKVRIPTSVKRMIIETLVSGYETNNALVNFKKYQSFWKALLREFVIGSFSKTVVKYPFFFDVHALVHSNIKTPKSKIEKLRKSGLLEEAFILEMENIGEMIRSISFYLRNKKGSIYPKKSGSITSNKITVVSDISKVIKSDKFLKVLSNASPKLLLQLQGILTDKTRLIPAYSRYISSKRTSVDYVTDNPVPALNKKMVKVVLEKVTEAYSNIKKKENLSLGNVFIDPILKNRKVSFSGRLDSGKNTSGQYLSLGSKISIPEMAKKGKLIRYGVSWKARGSSNISICIDPSVHFINGDLNDKIVNWQGSNNTINNEENKIIVSSSGDITDCSNSKFSTELVDIDGYELNKIGSSKFFTAIINYNSPSGDFKEVETYVFFNIIDRKDRVVGTRVSIALDKMDFSYEVNEAVSGQLGLLFDTEKGTVEVVKMAFDVDQSDSATNKRKFLKDLLKNRGELPNLYDSLFLAIDENQIISDKDKAKTVLDEEFDFSRIQSILM